MLGALAQRTVVGKGFLRRNAESELSFAIQFYSASILGPLVLGHRVINGVGGASSIIFKFKF
jgi:hypothetical protein